MSAPPPLDPFELVTKYICGWCFSVRILACVLFGSNQIKQWQRDDEKSEAVQEWSYRNKVILAPMVRISTLPMVGKKISCFVALCWILWWRPVLALQRILGRHYGADIVYSEVS